jgi:hypothetical protein
MLWIGKTIKGANLLAAAYWMSRCDSSGWDRQLACAAALRLMECTPPRTAIFAYIDSLMAAGADALFECFIHNFQRTLIGARTGSEAHFFSGLNDQSQVGGPLQLIWALRSAALNNSTADLPVVPSYKFKLRLVKPTSASTPAPSMLNVPGSGTVAPPSENWSVTKDREAFPFVPA